MFVGGGRMERVEGAETLLRAVVILADERRVAQPLSLVIIGGDSQNGASESKDTGGERARLEALAKKLGVEDQVRFVGAVDQGTLATYLNLASVCVVPSYSESFGLVALEAEACGTPVVAARVGGLPTSDRGALTGYTRGAREPARH